MHSSFLLSGLLPLVAAEACHSVIAKTHLYTSTVYTVEYTTLPAEPSCTFVNTVPSPSPDSEDETSPSSEPAFEWLPPVQSSAFEWLPPAPSSADEPIYTTLPGSPVEAEPSAPDCSDCVEATATATASLPGSETPSLGHTSGAGSSIDSPSLPGASSTSVTSVAPILTSITPKVPTSAAAEEPTVTGPAEASTSCESSTTVVEAPEPTTSAEEQPAVTTSPAEEASETTSCTTSTEEPAEVTGTSTVEPAETTSCTTSTEEPAEATGTSTAESAETTSCTTSIGEASETTTSGESAEPTSGTTTESVPGETTLSDDVSKTTTPATSATSVTTDEDSETSTLAEATSAQVETSTTATVDTSATSISTTAPVTTETSATSEPAAETSTTVSIDTPTTFSSISTTAVTTSSSSTTSEAATSTTSEPPAEPTLTRSYPADIVDELQDESMEKLREWLAENNSNGCTLENASIRREWGDLSVSQRTDYIDAVLCLQNAPSLYGSEVPGAQSRFDDFVATHSIQTNWIHGTANFLGWHRYFVHGWEKALREECGYAGVMPYWNWDRYADDLFNSPMFSGAADSLGGNSVGRCVATGPFKDMSVNLGPGPSLQRSARCLQRNISQRAASFTKVEITYPLITQSNSIASFQERLQSPNNVHASGHFTVGGNPGGDIYTSPGDPYFHLHHAGIDRLWWIWQLQDLNSRLSQIAGRDARTNRAGTLSELINLGVNAGDVELGSLLNTMGGLNGELCYIYY